MDTYAVVKCRLKGSGRRAPINRAAFAQRPKNTVGEGGRKGEQRSARVTGKQGAFGRLYRRPDTRPKDLSHLGSFLAGDILELYGAR